MPQPELIPMPFAENATPGTIEPIESTTPPRPQDATWSTGFPQVTMQPLASGGIPPRGQNFNGVLNALSQHIFHVQGGGQYKWDDAHGPYSIGDVLQSDDGLRSYVSVADNNTDNFNTNPSAIGTSWLPWSGGAASELVAGLIQLATTAEAQALTNDAKALTPKKLGDAMNAHVLGMGQSWQDVTPSRSAGVTYTNTTGRTIMVSANSRPSTSPTEKTQLQIYVDNMSVLRSSVPGVESGDGTNSAVCIAIPHGVTYRVDTFATTTILSWRELR